MTYTVTTYGPAEYLCRIGMIPGALDRLLVKALPRVTCVQVQAETAEWFGITLDDMKGPHRLRTIARPRQIAMYLSKEMTRLSLPQIGRKFNRDHTTVVHAVRQIEKLSKIDPEIRSDVRSIRARLEARA